jgi:hypothetical protein
MAAEEPRQGSENRMRIKTLLSLSLLVGFMPMTRGSAQTSVGIKIGINLGPERVVANYSSAQYGDWRTSYQQWQPITLYVVNGRYYEHQTRGARTVVVYRRNNDYFLPPQDKKWVGKDKRYDYKHQPRDEDYGRGKGNGKGKP